MSRLLFYNNKDELLVLDVSSQKAGELPETVMNLAAIKEMALLRSQRRKPELFKTLLVYLDHAPAIDEGMVWC